MSSGRKPAFPHSILVLASRAANVASNSEHEPPDVNINIARDARPFRLARRATAIPAAGRRSEQEAARSGRSTYSRLIYPARMYSGPFVCSTRSAHRNPIRPARRETKKAGFNLTLEFNGIMSQELRGQEARYQYICISEQVAYLDPKFLQLPGFRSKLPIYSYVMKNSSKSVFGLWVTSRLPFWCSKIVNSPILINRLLKHSRIWLASHGRMHVCLEHGSVGWFSRLGNRQKSARDQSVIGTFGVLHRKWVLKTQVTDND
ncbi:hypothetical protein B0H17DRAFT_1146327 [Mycena rosella]|uniref:Uncharacterized protein n=1 Tax=Mycena rosella TaxID=1033263 RepID=A0AAD7G3M2_MYCRO|nr:hypothetical protein B0H17DRAFT_1146327 [Mycena rosella]